MKFAIAFISLFVLAFAAPADDSASATIVRQEFENQGIDSYKFAVETSDGKSHSEEGQLKTIGDQEGISVTGQFSYIGDDGVTYTVTYTADENGFQPKGDHLPKLPEPSA